MTDPTSTVISLYEPVVHGNEIEFGWHVEPATAFYSQSTFRLAFPSAVLLDRIRRPVLWTAALLCLHAHWALFRPCVVRLPVRLPAGHRAFWERLLAAEIDTLEAYRGGLDYSSVTIAEGAESLPSEPRAAADESSFVAAFSGGKDSLLQAALLAELTTRPLLVTLNCVLPGLEDHLTRRREEVMTGVIERLGVELIEVTSDFRSSWDNFYPRQAGYAVSANEMSDVFLYLATAMLVADAAGAGHIAVAAENEGGEIQVRAGRVVQIAHSMVSFVTFAALTSLLRTLGFEFSSLIAPLHGFQVEELLWRRYPNVRDLQYSCWLVRKNQAACSACPKCLRTALIPLTVGVSPSVIGIDLRQLLLAMKDWKPERRDGLLPMGVADRRFDEPVARHLATIPARSVAAELFGRRPTQWFGPRTWQAVRAYRRLRTRMKALDLGSAPGYRPAYLALVDPALRERLSALYARHFDADEGYAVDTEASTNARFAAEIAGSCGT